MYTVTDAVAALSAAEAVLGSRLLTREDRLTTLRDIVASIPTRCANPRSAEVAKAAIQRAITEIADVRTDAPEAGTGSTEGLSAEADPAGSAEARAGSPEGLTEQAEKPRRLRGRRAGKPDDPAEAASEVQHGSEE